MIAKCKMEYATMYKPMCEQLAREKAVEKEKVGEKFAEDKLAMLKINEKEN